MLERRRHGLIALLLVLDSLALLGAFALAFAARFYGDALWEPWLGPAERPVPFGAYLWAAPVVWLLGLGAYAFAGLYRPERWGPGLAERGAIARALVLAGLAILAASALYRGRSYSRLVAALTLAGMGLGLPLMRTLARRVLGWMRRRGFSERRVLIVGEGASAEALAARFAERPWLGRGVKRCSGEVAALEAALRGSELDEVFLALPWSAGARVEDLERRLRSEAADVHIVLDLGDMVSLRARGSSLGGLPVMTLRESPGYGINAAAKRILDLLIAAPALVLAAPVMAVIALAIRLGGRGPVFYRQERVSWGGRPFSMVKFRTMRPDAEAGGPRMTSRDDPRRTRLGSFLRRSSLDELPQLWNVLRGEMSLVGPRPERPEFLPKIAESLPHFPLRQCVKAGMTGWAQIHGRRGNSPFVERLRFDLDYVENWSLGFDMSILVRTLLGGFLSRNAI